MAKTVTRMIGPVQMTSPTDPVKIKKFGEWVDQGGDNNTNAIELLRPARPGDTFHAREEPEAPAYSKGGRVKYGSDTRVMCSHKHR